MRYSIFLPESKGGYKVGEEDDLIAAFCSRQNLDQKFQVACVIYDSEMKTTDVQAMMNDKFRRDYHLK